MILHTVNKKQDCLQNCISVLGENDAILLIEDGVYATMAVNNGIDIWENIPPSTRLFALENDLVARGVSDKILPRFEAITLSQFVSLSCEYDKVISWG
ncbi:MAG: tRNA 2-thiouridine synthesizing protein B [Pseudohongiellaceae bacterium]|jgi:tRNA 2-thiouridine synthesizing protein B|tara:strand:- start:1450 stop:1743 length:294 start_codon:yes stop_codon:yes gene_type:complete